MKKRYVFLLLVFFVNVNAYQPPEFGIFFENSAGQTNQKSIVNKTINIEREKRTDGTYSSVYIIKDVPEFLYFVTKQSLPLIINFHSKENVNKVLYQEVADTFINKFVFVSVNSTKNKQLTQLLFLFLRFDGFSFLPAKIKYPLVLFCRQNSVLLQNGLIHLKKDSLKNLINPGFFDKNELLQKLKEISDIRENG